MFIKLNGVQRQIIVLYPLILKFGQSGYYHSFTQKTNFTRVQYMNAA